MIVLLISILRIILKYLLIKILANSKNKVNILSKKSIKLIIYKKKPRKTDFLFFNTQLAFNILQQVFIIILIFYLFDLKYYI